MPIATRWILCENIYENWRIPLNKRQFIVLFSVSNECFIDEYFYFCIVCLLCLTCISLLGFLNMYVDHFHCIYVRYLYFWVVLPSVVFLASFLHITIKTKCGHTYILIFFWVFLNIHNILLLILNLRVCVCVWVCPRVTIWFLNVVSRNVHEVPKMWTTLTDFQTILIIKFENQATSSRNWALIPNWSKRNMSELLFQYHQFWKSIFQNEQR